MRRGFSGEYSTRQLGGETVNAFVPQPLPPCPAPEITGSRARRHEQALLACGRLDSITQLLPEPDLFLYAYIRREALVSSQIEGTQSSLSDLLLFELDSPYPTGSCARCMRGCSPVVAAPGCSLGHSADHRAGSAERGPETPVSSLRRLSMCRT